MNKKKLAWWAFALVTLVVAVIQFVPSPPLVVPAQLPAEQQPDKGKAFQDIPADPE